MLDHLFIFDDNSMITEENTYLHTNVFKSLNWKAFYDPVMNDRCKVWTIYSRKSRLTDIYFVSLVNFFKDFEITKRIHVLAVSE